MKQIAQIKHVLKVILLIGVSNIGLAQTLNPSSISTNGSVNVIVQDSATIYVGGSFSSAGFKSTGIAKINSNARTEVNFPSLGGACHATISDGSGGWYVGGFFSVQGLSNLVHILPDNTIDMSFAPNPNGFVWALYLDGSTLYVGGQFAQINGQSQSRLASLDASTGALLPWNPAPDGIINAIAKDGNTVYIGGGFNNVGGRENRHFAAIDAITALAIPTISTSSNVKVIEQDSTSVYLGGDFNTSSLVINSGYYTGANALLTTNSDLPDFSFPKIASVSGTVTKSIPDGSGGWYVGGLFSIQGLSNLVHILPDNTVDVSFTPNPNGFVWALYLDGSTLYVGGQFTQIGGQPQGRLASLNANTGALLPWNPAPDGIINAIAKDGNTVYIGGGFNNVGGRENRHFAAVDANTALAIPTISASSTVKVIEQDSVNIYIGGDFNTSSLVINSGYYTGANALLATTSDLPDFNFPKIASASGTVTKSIPDGSGGWYVGGLFSIQGLSNLVHILPDNTIDMSFAPNPNGFVWALYLDGSTLYVGGQFTQISGQSQGRLASLNANTGALLPWNPAPDGIVRAITKEGNTIYIGGGFNNVAGQARTGLAAISATTALPTSWIANANSTVNVLEINGLEIIAGGSFSLIGGQSRNYLAAISLTTGNVSIWNPNPNNTIEAMELNGANAYVGGSFTTIGGEFRRNIAEISLSTANATTWNPNANATVRAIKLIGSTIYAGGSFTTIGGQPRNFLAALNNTDGSATSWDAAPSAAVNTLSVNGTAIFAGGSFTYLKSLSRNYLMAISKSSGLITSWNPNPNNPIEAIELNGVNAYVGGSFTSVGGQSRNCIAEISLSTANATTWNPIANATVRAIKLIGSNIYAGGSFTTIGGQSRNFLAALNNTDGNATSWDAAPSAAVNTLSVNGTAIFAGGSFTYLKSSSRNYLMAISKSSGLITSWNPNPNNTIEAIELNGANVYVGGAFTSVGGQSRNYIAEISLLTGNATTWNPNANAAVRAIKWIGPTIYAGGSFTNIGGQARNYLAALNNTDGNATTWDAKPDGPVFKIAQDNTGIIAAGSFAFMRSEQRSNLLAISKTTGLITDWSPNPSNVIEAIELNGNNAYIGGSFTSIGGQPRNNIAEVSLLTGSATTWNPIANSVVKTIKRFGANVYVGGDFTAIGGQNRNRLAALDATTGNATDWNPNASWVVNRILVSDSILYVAGNFTTLSGQNRNRLASFTLPDEVLTTWNPDVSGPINDMYISGSNIYIGGNFNQVSEQNRSNLASFAKLTGNLKSWNPGLTGPVSSIISKGKYIFTGGSFNKVGGLSCSGFAVINANTGIPELFFPSVTGQVKALAAFDSLIYLGGNYSSIDGFTLVGLASVSYPSSTFNAEIEDFSPKAGGNVGDVTVIIHGNGFEGGTVVKLTKNGQPDILMESLYISDGIQITGTFNLRDKLIGSWNLVVEIPSDTTMIINDGFSVEQGILPSVWTDIVGFDRIRIGQWQSYNLVYGNSGNVDAHGVPIWFTVSDNADVNLGFQFQKNYEYFDISTDSLYDLIPPYFVVDTVMDMPGPFKLVGLYFNSIPTNTVNTVSFKVKINSTGSISMRSWAGANHFGSPMQPWVKDCLVDVVSIAATGIGCIPIPVAQAIKTSANVIGCITSAYSIYQGVSNLSGGVTAGNVFKAAGMLFTGTLDCAQSFIPSNDCLKGLTTLGKAVALLNKSAFNAATTGGGTIPNYSPVLPNCVPPPIPPKETPPVNTINSFDPNDKLGPIGEGSANFINVTDRVLPYIIRCENADTASAAAQTVVIIDTLDQNVFDLSSFQLGFFSIADSIITIPSGLKHYETDIDLRPANDIIARVKANLNMQTGVARWEFTSLDPLTLKPTEIPVAGFLPPNVNKPEGEAAVMFSIKTKDNISNGAQIKNKAYIYFDLNPPIITNEWTNTSDVVKPVSHMNALPPVQYGDSTITLTWAGSDIGSGVRDYRIYYSVNGGPFNVLASYLTGNSLTFTGNIDSTYSFFSIAIDSVGNVENMKDVAEATTSFVVSAKEDFHFDNIKVSIYPNPNQGKFDLSIVSPNTGTFYLSITDVFGRVIYDQKQDLVLGNNILPLSIERSGMYFITIGNLKERIVRKVLVNK